MLSRSLVSLAVFLGSRNLAVTAQDSPATTTTHRRHAQHNINYYYARQLLPLTSSSSYDYWWPYPPAGATSTTTYTPYTPTDTSFPSPTDASAFGLAFSFESDAASSSSSNSGSLSLTSTDSLSASYSASQSASIIFISALPPSNSSIPFSSHHKLAVQSTNNLVYIVPVCAVVGVLIGGITTWCVYGCLTRNGHGRKRRTGRRSYGTLEVGPEYKPPTPRPGEEEQDEGVWVADERRPEESDTDDTFYASDDDCQADVDDDGQRDGETEGFLHPGSANKPSRAAMHRTTRNKSTTSTATRVKSTRSSRAPSPTPSGRTSLYFDRADSAQDSLPWESLRHKSIKRGILERLRYDDDQRVQVGRRSWQAHGRHDSDLLVQDAQEAALSRATSSATASTAQGFRILTESPAGTPQKERGAEVFAWPSVEDKYTRVPERVARSRSRSLEKSARVASPEKFARATSPPARAVSPPVGRGKRGTRLPDDGGAQRGRARNADIRSVLPQSPPRISSPVLDGTLCFTPISKAYDTTPTLPTFASFGAPVA
ncbi:hypothetical protein B0H10DRAFT_2051555 [Mycena sp. CBHHK59/15]|nr:hypothetical protein B0H10DRAFT_2051555 [Mycena sp. CBHHK59/15]